MQEQVIFSVTQINEYIKMTLESSSVLKNVLLRGEISNFKSNYSSGHLYFSLKDEASSIRAVMFRSSASRLKFRLEGGMKVIVRGRISAYTVSGDCQIIVEDMQPDGAGAMALAFEQLKKRLMAEGLFDIERKKPIPKFPKSVGVITSASGAALHDIINVSGRRSPSTEIVIYPSYVQGDLAPKSLKGGILFFNDRKNVDVIIIGRGGGSAEDLWCFNDESLARAISDSTIPVISAVGHETDFTICDFVSDLRAPTPSAAAELAFPDNAEILSRIRDLSLKSDRYLRGKVDRFCANLELLRTSVKLNSPQKKLSDRQSNLALLREKINAAQKHIFENKCAQFQTLCARLEGVNPLSVLAHGYSVVENEKGNIVSSICDVELDERITVKLADGSISAIVNGKNLKK